MHVLELPPCSSFVAPSIGRFQHSGKSSPSGRGKPSYGPYSAASELQQSYPSPPMSDKPPSPPPRARTHHQQKEKFDHFPEQHEHRYPQGPALEEPGNRSSGRLEPRQVELQPRRIYQTQREPTAANTSDPPQDPRTLAIQERLPTASMLAEPRPQPQMGPFGYSPLARTGSFGSGYGGPTLASVPQDAALAGQIPLRNPKTARRNKAHVASACVNCKRAHLSCDVQRPCMRCVASGKEVRDFPTNLTFHR